MADFTSLNKTIGACMLECYFYCCKMGDMQVACKFWVYGKIILHLLCEFAMLMLFQSKSHDKKYVFFRLCLHKGIGGKDPTKVLYVIINSLVPSIIFTHVLHVQELMLQYVPKTGTSKWNVWPTNCNILGWQRYS